MQTEDELLRRITVNPAIFQGKPTIRGMRIKVGTVLSPLEQGVSVKEILDDYPDLERDDIRACLRLAAGWGQITFREAVSYERVQR